MACFYPSDLMFGQTFQATSLWLKTHFPSEHSAWSPNLNILTIRLTWILTYAATWILIYYSDIQSHIYLCIDLVTLKTYFDLHSGNYSNINFDAKFHLGSGEFHATHIWHTSMFWHQLGHVVWQLIWHVFSIFTCYIFSDHLTFALETFMWHLLTCAQTAQTHLIYFFKETAWQQPSHLVWRFPGPQLCSPNHSLFLFF